MHEGKATPVKMSELTECFTVCDETHSIAVTYGCTVCYFLVCTECLRDQQSIKQQCHCKGEKPLRKIRPACVTQVSVVPHINHFSPLLLV